MDSVFPLDCCGNAVATVATSRDELDNVGLASHHLTQSGLAGTGRSRPLSPACRVPNVRGTG